jgi:hypothetical protein
MASSGSAQVGTNLSYTKFLFLILAKEDEAVFSRVRNAGSLVARGFFNDFDADGSRDVQPRETIQFLITDRELTSDGGIGAARYAMQASANYRPRLVELECELKRRLGAVAEVVSIDGADRAPRYTSAEMHDYAYKPAMARLSGRVARCAVIVPVNKTDGWWQKSVLERHGYFYPHRDRFTGGEVKGHARAAEAGISTLFRRLYHNPDGYQRPNEYDFVTYFECTDEHLATFDKVREALRDKTQNPEWQYVLEGPEWRGRRVMRW